MGLGMSSIYATSILWCEKYIAVTNSVGALFTLFGMAVANVLQVVLGGLVEAFPMSLFYVNLAIVAGCVAIFGVAVAVGESMLKEDAEATALLPPPREERTK